ncbi:MAG: DUF1587 domain-containing protein, partial [Opitutales bacterium]|nr:DUF1587 domain-containing protein [Opitutales bacterium]
MRRLLLISAPLMLMPLLDASPRFEFLQKYCIDCHGADKQKGNRRFDGLTENVSGIEDLEMWQEVLDLLNLGEMPPEEEKQPPLEERLSMIESITGLVTNGLASLSDTGGHSMLRRINSWEYRQTIGDLLDVNVFAWNPAKDFPKEVVKHGFDNIGSELVTSGMLLDHYFDAAEEAGSRATNFGKKPQFKRYVQKSPVYFQGKENADLPKLFQVDRFRFIPE